MSKKDSYNKAGLLTALTTFLAIFVFFFYIMFVYEGIDLKEVKKFNTASNDASTVSKEISIHSKTPWVESEELIQRGRSVHQVNCAVCHGNKGLGDGIAGKGLVKPPRNFVKGDWTKGGDRLSLFQSITKGINGTSMAAFGHLPLVDRWALVHFIRSLTKNKVKDGTIEAKAKDLK